MPGIQDDSSAFGELTEAIDSNREGRLVGKQADQISIASRGPVPASARLGVSWFSTSIDKKMRSLRTCQNHCAEPPRTLRLRNRGKLDAA
jgi:hypothetical protein